MDHMMPLYHMISPVWYRDLRVSTGIPMTVKEPAMPPANSVFSGLRSLWQISSTVIIL